MRVEPQRRQSAEELMLSCCGAGEDLRVPGTARRSNQLILKEINSEYSLEGWMLKSTDSTDMSLSKLGETAKDRETWRAAVLEVAKSWTQLSN